MVIMFPDCYACGDGGATVEVLGRCYCRSCAEDGQHECESCESPWVEDEDGVKLCQAHADARRQRQATEFALWEASQ